MLGSLRRQHEGRLGQVELGCDRLHLPCGQFSSVGYNGERIAAELPISEHIEGDEFHLHDALQLPWASFQTPTFRIRSLCCALAASGHVAAPQSSVMNWRRFT